jgi:glycosyltransferase involved in cell wall biosynthesis
VESEQPMELTIVVPVLNEEGSVERVARGCLAAATSIVQRTKVTAVHVVVVSDGSTDRSAEIARSIAGVTTIVLEKNQGYGAAIQCGWAQCPAELLAFLDGDGTCDPEAFIGLINALGEQPADLALGARMGPGSRMPALRRLGNWFFALMLGLLARQPITDSASGMRVLRASALKDLLPLPSGLHFTPAMSARALLAGLTVVEVAMPYAERVGQSKLRVVSDGLRFLGVILAAAAYIRPSRLVFPVIAALFAVALAIGAYPTHFYLRHHRLEEWMIYRFLFISLLADIGVLLFCSTLIAEHVIALGLLRYRVFLRGAPWWWGDRGLRLYTLLAAVGVAGGAYLVWPGLWSFVTTGRITFEKMHWSRVIVAAFSGMSFLQIVVTRLLLALLTEVQTRQRMLLDEDGSVPPQARGAPSEPQGSLRSG